MQELLALSSLPGSLSSLGLKYLEEDELRKRFNHYDVNNNGCIDREEAKQMLRDAGTAEPSGAQADELIEAMDATHDGTVHWEEFKAAVDKAAEPVDPRVKPISGSLMLYFVGTGVNIPVLPLFMKTLGLAPFEMGIVNSCHSLSKLATNVPGAMLVERVGRRPLLVGGAAVESVAMAPHATRPRTCRCVRSLERTSVVRRPGWA
jgi:hypothetical protein